ncbi:MAG: galactokinase [Candidatus Omnitrophota bacterium]|nr:galactokinase [Candidatus Omnitrophota bacterium]
MIITRTPLRICLGGGGTDVKEYYEQFGGYVVSAALDQYIYIVIHSSFDKSIRICYSKREIVNTADEVQHPVVREAMKLFRIKDTGIEIISFADVPSDTGLGSSSSFTVGLIAALAAHKGLRMTQYEIAHMACRIEREILAEAGGKQDQYIAAFGGISRMVFEPGGGVVVSPVQISHESIDRLENDILLFYTGIKRNSFKVQQALVRGVKKETRTLDNLHRIKNLGIQIEEILRTGEIDRYADFLREHWEAKQKLSDMVSNGRIHRLYETALDNGASAGKIIGAGGGGYLMLHSSDPVNRQRLREAMAAEELEELKFSFDFTGTTVLVDDGIRNKHTKAALV